MKKKISKMLNSRLTISGLFILALILTASIFYVPTSAQTAISGKGLTVSPVSVEKDVDAGKSVDFTAKATNTSSTDENVKVRVNEYTVYGEEGQVQLVEPSANGIVSWTKLSTDSFTLKPGESKEVTATVNVPSNAAGGHYAAFVFSLPGQPTSSGPGVSQDISSLFLLKVNGTEKEILSLDEFKTSYFNEFGPVTFNMKFNNTGNVHVKPVGIIDVTDIFNRKIASMVFDGSNVFPGTSRVMTSQLSNKWLLGPFKATAVLSYGKNNETLVQSASFLVFPYRVAAVVLLVLVIVFLLRKRLGKALKALGGK